MVESSQFCTCFSYMHINLLSSLRKTT